MKNQDNFCYVCGEYVVKKNKRNFTYLLRENYLQYFGLATENLDEQWTPSIICLSCHMNLMGWASGSTEYVFSDALYDIYMKYFHGLQPFSLNIRWHMKFGVPMIWRKPFCHATDCYFCLRKQTGIGKNMRWQYANVQSVTFPVLHSDTLPIPKYPSSSDLNLSSSSLDETTDSEFEPSQESRLLTQPDLND